jgi:hypothetical protein
MSSWFLQFCFISVVSGFASVVIRPFILQIDLSQTRLRQAYFAEALIDKPRAGFGDQALERFAFTTQQGLRGILGLEHFLVGSCDYTPAFWIDQFDQNLQRGLPGKNFVGSDADLQHGIG